MTQEDKDLLIKDLCTRLPYGVKVHIKLFDFEFDSKLVQIYNGVGCSFEVTNGMSYAIDDIKPYLFPMSSMTDEQKKEWLYTLSSDYNITYDTIDWLNKNHFDYQGLIERGLAIDATGLNIY